MISFLFLSVALFLLNIPWWSNSVWWPATDSAFIGQSFYAFYSEFFYHHEIIRWFPYGTFGIVASHWQLFDLTPSSYLSIILGSMLKVKNALLVFKISILLEQWMMLIGIYLFCKRAFRHEVTRFFVSVALVGSTVWFVQIYWNFRIYYLLPWVLYCIHRAFCDRRFDFLCYGGIVELFSLLGVPSYFFIAHFFVITFFILGLFFKLGLPNLSLRFRRSDWWRMGIGVFLATAYALFLRDGYQNIFFTSGFDRDASRYFQTPLNSFLHHGIEDSIHGMAQFFQMIFPTFFHRVLGESSVNVNDVTLYVGLVPILFLITSLFICLKDRLYQAWLLMSVFFIFLMLGKDTPVAAWAYEFLIPLRYFRYLNGLAGIIRLLLIVLAGFGLDAYLSRLDSQDVKVRYHLKLALITSISVLFGSFLCRQFFVEQFRITLQWQHYYIFTISLCLIAFLLTIVLVNHWKMRQAQVKWLIVVFLAVDLFSYQGLVFANWTNHWDWAGSLVRQVHPNSYQNQRSMNYDNTERTREAFRVVEMNMTRAGIASHAFLQSDPCLTQYVTRFWPNDAYRVIASRWPEISENNFSFKELLNHPDRINFFYATGCYTDKTRLFTNAICLQDSLQAEDVFRGINDLSKTVMIEGISPEHTSCDVKTSSDVVSGGSIQSSGFSSNRAHFQVNVGGRGAWFYYPDGFHPGWSARVDGEEVKIYKANLAFKAIWLKPGNHDVQFRFSNGPQNFLSYAIALLCVLFALIMLIVGVGQLLRTNRHDF